METRIRLSLSEWEDIFYNLQDIGEEVEIIYLDGTDEWVLCFDCELFEDGFKSEQEAQERLNYLEDEILQ